MPDRCERCQAEALARGESGPWLCPECLLTNNPPAGGHEQVHPTVRTRYRELTPAESATLEEPLDER